MLSSIREFFSTNIQSISGGQRHIPSNKALQLATASLLIEVSRADFHIDHSERKTIIEAIKKIFDLSRQETDTIIELAEKEVEDATSLYEFTSLVNQYFDYDQKLHVVENMWRVAGADLNQHKYEEYVIRKVCELIHVSHRDFVRLKHVTVDA